MKYKFYIFFSIIFVFILGILVYTNSLFLFGIDKNNSQYTKKIEDTNQNNYTLVSEANYYPSYEEEIVYNSIILENLDNEPIKYFTDSNLFKITKVTHNFLYNVDMFESINEECNRVKDKNYLKKLVEKFNSTKTIEYQNTYLAESNDPKIFTISLIPNVVDYKDIDDFKSDFDLCEAGGYFYPIKMNKDWLVFINSCGSGGVSADYDRSMPFGCDEISKLVEDSISIR